MGAVGENMSTKQGTRLYRTPDHNLVAINSSSVSDPPINGIANYIEVTRVLKPTSEVKPYLGKLAGMERYYIAGIPAGDEKVIQSACTRIERFSKKGNIQTIPHSMDICSDNGYVKTFLEPVSASPSIDSSLARKVTKRSYNVQRVLPYETAVSQGLRV